MSEDNQAGWEQQQQLLDNERWLDEQNVPAKTLINPTDEQLDRIFKGAI